MTVTNVVQQPTLTRAAKIVDIAAKVGLVLLLVIAVAYPDLGNVRGKAAGLRAAAYPMGALVVPAVWWLLWRRRGRPFPWLGDALVTLPWFTDTLGNRLNLFDAIDWFDDWMHFMNWALLTAGMLVLTLPARPARVRWWSARWPSGSRRRSDGRLRSSSPSSGRRRNATLPTRTRSEICRWARSGRWSPLWSSECCGTVARSTRPHTSTHATSVRSVERRRGLKVVVAVERQVDRPGVAVLVLKGADGSVFDRVVGTRPPR